MSEFVQPQKKGDLRGGLNVFERSQEIPFDVKRIYYLFDTAPDVSRGFHAHKSLQQLAICLAGNCEIILDNGHARELVQLNPHSGAFRLSQRTFQIREGSQKIPYLTMHFLVPIPPPLNNYSRDIYY